MLAEINAFKTYLQQVGYSESTVRMLPVLLTEFSEQQQIQSVDYVEKIKVRNFLEYLQTRPLKKRSGSLSEMMISHYVYALKTFFSWLEMTQQTSFNPISGMKFKRPKQNQRKPLSEAEIHGLFAAAETEKERVVLHFFYSCGLRRTEGEKLNTSDINFKQKLLYVREGKGSKRRVIPITDKVKDDLESYYQNERTKTVPERTTDNEAFLLNQKGGRISGNTCNKIVQNIQSRTDIREIISLHHLRHSIATHLLQSGMNMEYVQSFLGHDYLETTEIYAKPKYEQLQLL